MTTESQSAITPATNEDAVEIVQRINAASQAVMDSWANGGPTSEEEVEYNKMSNMYTDMFRGVKKVMGLAEHLQDNDAMEMAQAMHDHVYPKMAEALDNYSSLVSQSD